MASPPPTISISVLLLDLRDGSRPLLLPEDESDLILEERVIRLPSGQNVPRVSAISTLALTPASGIEPAQFIRPIGARPLDSNLAVPAPTWIDAINSRPASSLAPMSASINVFAMPTPLNRTRERLASLTATAEAKSAHQQALGNQSPPPTDRAEFVHPSSPSVATIHCYSPPPGNTASPTAHVISPPSTNSSTGLARSSLIIPRASNSEIPGGEQITEALVLHNFLSHRGYILDWADEPVPRYRAWKSTALVDGHPFGIGIASRKAEARQAAAAHALAYFRSHPTALPSRRRMYSTA